MLRLASISAVRGAPLKVPLQSKAKGRKAGSVRADRQNRGNVVVHENGLDPSDSAVVRCFFLEIIPPIFCMEPFLFSKSVMKIRHPLDLTIKAIRVLRGRDRWAVNKVPPLYLLPRL